MQIILDKAVVSFIKSFIDEKKRVLEIDQKILGEDIFDVISKQDVVLLYYYIDDEIEGCHMHKPIKTGEIKQFIFINTKTIIQEQVWTAGHELGHVWKIDEKIQSEIKDCRYDREDLVGRFTAELLIPEYEFIKHFNKKIEDMHINPKRVSLEHMLEIIAYLMNLFCTPYKSIVKRFVEVGLFDEKDYEKNYEKLVQYCYSKELEQVIKENQYSRINKENKRNLIDNLAKDLEEIEKKKLMNVNKINKIRGLFEIERQEESKDFFGLNTIG